jgi:hypothetical protein
MTVAEGRHPRAFTFGRPAPSYASPAVLLIVDKNAAFWLKLAHLAIFLHKINRADFKKDDMIT